MHGLAFCIVSYTCGPAGPVCPVSPGRGAGVLGAVFVIVASRLQSTSTESAGVITASPAHRQTDTHRHYWLTTQQGTVSYSSVGFFNSRIFCPNIIVDIINRLKTLMFCLSAINEIND